MVQLVTPVRIVSNLAAPDDFARFGLFGTLRLHFVPEPGTFALLATGFAGLAALAQRRRRRSP